MLRSNLKIKIKIWVSKKYINYPIVKDIVNYLSENKFPTKTFSQDYVFYFEEKGLQFVLSSLERLNLYPEDSPKIVAHPNTELPADKEKLEKYIIKNANKIPFERTNPVIYFRILIKMSNKKARKHAMSVEFIVETIDLFWGGRCLVYPVIQIYPWKFIIFLL